MIDRSEAEISELTNGNFFCLSVCLSEILFYKFESVFSSFFVS